MSHARPGQPIGLSRRLKELDALNDGFLLPFDLEAVIRAGRRRRQRRIAASVITAVASFTTIATLVTALFRGRTGKTIEKVSGPTP